MSAANGGRKRASRRARVKGRGIRLRGRDVDILLALSKMLLLSTSQLTRLFFIAKGTCQKRLRKLFDSELIRAVIIDQLSENRYALTRLGYALLEKALPNEPLPPFRSPPRVDRRGLMHHDLIIHYWISLALGAAEKGVTLCRFEPDWELRSRQIDSPVIPDAMVTLANDRSEWHIAFEAHTGTMSLRVIGRKLDTYARLLSTGSAIFGVADPLVCIVGMTERRIRTLARHLQQQRAMRIVLSSQEAIAKNGGVSSGLSYPADFSMDGGSEATGVFSRGMLLPEGIPAKTAERH